MLEITKVKKQTMLYTYLESLGTCKDDLRLVSSDEDLFEICSWVLRFKVILFYADRRGVESLISILKNQLYMKKKTCSQKFNCN